MKKLITAFGEYPNTLESAEGVEIMREHIILPTPREISFLHNERLDKSDSINYTIDTLVIAIFRDAENRKYWKFGCGFCDSLKDIENLASYQVAYFRAFLDKYNRGHLSNKGLEYLFDNYMQKYNFYKSRV